MTGDRTQISRVTRDAGLDITRANLKPGNQKPESRIRKPESGNVLSIFNRRPISIYCKSPPILVGQRIKYFILHRNVSSWYKLFSSPPRYCLQTTGSKMIHHTRWRQCCKCCASHQSSLGNVSLTWTRTALSALQCTG